MKTSRTSYYYFILFITIILSIITHQTLAIQRPTTTTTTTTTIYTEFIKTSCKTTTYPDLCYNSLLTHAPVIQTNPKLLASTALSVTLDTAVTTSDAVSRMMMSSKGGQKTMLLLPREAGAMRDCLEVLSDAISELQSSIKEMGEIVTTNESNSNNNNYRLLINDVQTWVSAALTDENTCMEGFGGKVMDGSVKTIIRGKIEIICHLTSNSLALINNFATLHG